MIVHWISNQPSCFCAEFLYICIYFWWVKYFSIHIRKKQLSANILVMTPFFFFSLLYMFCQWETILSVLYNIALYHIKYYQFLRREAQNKLSFSDLFIDSNYLFQDCPKKGEGLNFFTWIFFFGPVPFPLPFPLLWLYCLLSLCLLASFITFYKIDHPGNPEKDMWSGRKCWMLSLVAAALCYWSWKLIGIVLIVVIMILLKKKFLFVWLHYLQMS